ncbi:Cell division coordinator CpoB [subsurface metagenome]
MSRKKIIQKILYFCLLPSAFCLVLNGCAYFNAYYLAQKNFKDGEYARKRNDGVADETAKMKYKAAIKWSKEVMEKYDGSRYTDDSMYIIGLSYYYQNEFVLARTQLDELLSTYPDSKYIEEAKYYKARSYIGMEQDDNARMVLNELIKSDNRSIMGRAGLALAEISSNNEKWDELLVGAQTVIDTEPEKIELITATVYKGEALYQLERYEECLAVLEKLSDFNIDPYLRFRTNYLRVCFVCAKNKT